MEIIDVNGTQLHWREDGERDGVPIVFSNSLGTDLRLWEKILPLLPSGFRIIRYDKRGHGLSACPPGPYSMDQLASDAEALIEKLAGQPVIFVGLSIGGLIGQTLASRRPDLIKALVLSNTAVKMGDEEMWATRIATVKKDGLEAYADAVLDRWFGPTFRNSAEALLWNNMLSRTPDEGYLACCAAIAATDLTETTSQLTLPALGIAGTEDKASTPELVQNTCNLIPGCDCHVIEGAGHLPCVEKPQEYADILSPFLVQHRG